MSGRPRDAALWGFSGAIIAALIGAFATMAANRPPEGGSPSPPYVPADEEPDTRPTAAVTVDNVWLEHDVFEDGQKGVRVHARITATGRKGVKESVAAYFYLEGEPLRDGNGRYASEDGTVSTGDSFIPDYNEANSHELAMFLPLDELELAPGSHEVTARVQVFDHALDRFVARAQPVSFTYTRTAPAPAIVSPPPAAPSTPVAASVFISRVWLEYDVTSMGVMGMNIHVAFTANLLQGTPLTVSAGFSDASGALLRDYNGTFRFADGTVGVIGTTIPIYPAAEFKDFVLFIPYAELHMAPGVHSLQARVGIGTAASPAPLAVSDGVNFEFRS